MIHFQQVASNRDQPCTFGVKYLKLNIPVYIVRLVFYNIIPEIPEVYLG
jgi:hypothetical protein